MDEKTKLIIELSAVVILLAVCVLAVAWNIRKVNRTRYPEQKAPMRLFGVAWFLLGPAMGITMNDLGIPETFAAIIGIVLWFGVLFIADKVNKMGTKEVREEYNRGRFGPWG